MKEKRLEEIIGDVILRWYGFSNISRNNLTQDLTQAIKLWIRGEIEKIEKAYTIVRKDTLLKILGCKKEEDEP